MGPSFSIGVVVIYHGAVGTNLLHRTRVDTNKTSLKVRLGAHNLMPDPAIQRRIEQILLALLCLVLESRTRQPIPLVSAFSVSSVYSVVLSLLRICVNL